MAELGQYAKDLEDGKLTRDDVVRIALTHLLEQGVKSVNGEECVYEGYNGICCGAAPFIKDYKPTIEGDGWGDVRHTDRHCDLICVIQMIHDGCEPSRWISEFKQNFPDVDFSFIENIKIHENCRS